MNAPSPIDRFLFLMKILSRSLRVQSFAAACFLSFCLVLLAASTAVRGAETNSNQPQTKLIAPGIWRLRFGEPEQFTPTHFRSAEMDTADLEKMPAGQPMPLDVTAISFQISDRGCSLLLPMKPGENIYGFGLHTELFNMTGRSVFLKPTDKPENDLGESHAPAPFYVSSEGYGVFVDTARFASFHTGNVSPVGSLEETNNGEIQTNTTELYRARAQRTKTTLVDVPAAKGVDVYIFAGPAMLDAVERYNLFSGGGSLPPLWGLGVQYRGYTKYGAAETLALAARIRDAHMPCDVWGVEPGWQAKAYPCSFVWDTNRFPRPGRFSPKNGRDELPDEFLGTCLHTLVVANLRRAETMVGKLSRLERIGSRFCDAAGANHLSQTKQGRIVRSKR